ncbi:UNVERIFIED_CONTAM: protein FAR1-RELATED SEQUENCE 9 [Sesamum radiatum]|uniref:Protein FAR1-RELATED SEQUENCE n=1 Tax=Sesamum radiatum TaxID=300843 RepID=A0AAW2LM07_SESRA
MNHSSNRQRNLGPGVQYLLDYLKRMQAENPGFFYATEGDSEQCGNVFWTDATSRANYSYFGDTVRVDTSYRTNRSKIPFITFTGINHHAQPVLFGCALLLNETDNSFIWLLQTWLRAMSGRSPVSITCDPDRLIQMAVAQVLPEARSRFCRWSIFRQTHEKLSNVYQTNSTFDFEFQKCVNEADTVEEFESCWATLLSRYYLMDNEWLQSLYNIRDQWVPIYLRDVFFGELSTVEHNDALSLFLDGLLSTSTTIQLLIKQYEKTISSWHEKELKDDFDTSNTTPVLKTPSPMEKQAANLYTRRIFMKFQGELVETLANPATIVDDSGTVITYRVAKFGEEHKAHAVRFNAFEMKATCSCRMFEFSGIICRHVLSVFRAKNVLMLPPEYVLKRWTRNAKMGVGESEPDSAFGLPSNSQDSPIVRHNNLRQEAVKYVEEGAKSIHVYNVAMSALQEASKRVAAAKCKNSGTTLGTTEANGGNLEMNAIENQSASCLSREEKEKKIRELSTELERTNQRCEVYRAILLALFRDIEDQKLKLSVKRSSAFALGEISCYPVR